MLKVAILQVSALLGGSDRSLLCLLKEAHGRLFNASVVLPNSGPLCSHLTDIGVPWIIVEQPRKLLSLSRSFELSSCFNIAAIPFVIPHYIRDLLRTLRCISPDVIYTNGIKAHVFATLLHFVNNIPTVWHLRDNWGGAALGKMGEYGATSIIANSYSTAARILPYINDTDKVTVVYNSVDTEEFSPAGPVESIDTGGTAEYRVALPGPFARIKGHKLLLQAARTVLDHFPSTDIFFIGGSIYETLRDVGYCNEVINLVDLYGLTKRVVFTGFQEHMPPWYRAMDIIVNTSIYPEGFGRTLLEGMACGKPVIGPRAGGVPELVNHGHNGFLYTMGNAQELANAIILLLRDPALRQRVGMAGRETAIKRFTPAKHAEAISNILHSAYRSALKKC